MMRANLKAILALTLICPFVLAGCRSLENTRDKDWARVQITVDQQSLSSGGNLSVSPDNTRTALITVIPATISAVDASTDLVNAYDSQLQSLSAGTVTLSVPLNESLQLIKKTFADTLTLPQAVANRSPTAIGTSAAFTVDGNVISKTVTINLTRTSTGELSGAWTFVDGNGTSGINKDPARSTLAGSMVVYNAALYAGWTEESAANTLKEGYGQIRVAGWNGVSTWSFVDGNQADGLNFDVTRQAEHVNFAVFGSKLFLAWTEYSATSKRQIRVKSWNGAQWASQESSSASGLNYSPAQEARLPSMAVMGSNLYLAWEEKNSCCEQIRVKKWDGSTWSYIDGGGDSGINQNSLKAAKEPRLVVFNTKLYAIWREQTITTGNPWQVRLAEWNGSTGWVFKDSGSDAGFNFDTSKSVGEYPFAFVFNSKLYIAWTEANASSVDQLRVLEWNGTTPRFVDGNSGNGLNRDATKGTFAPSLFEFNSKLLLAWSEPNASGNHQLRVAQWDGSSAWTFVDGAGVNGINKDSTNSALIPAAVIYNSKLYLSFMEGRYLITERADTTRLDQIRVVEAQTN
ncbi:MAG: hypothetical protein ABIK68_16285 [bacterium]